MQTVYVLIGHFVYVFYVHIGACVWFSGAVVTTAADPPVAQWYGPTWPQSFRRWSKHPATCPAPQAAQGPLATRHQPSEDCSCAAPPSPCLVHLRGIDSWICSCSTPSLPWLLWMRKAQMGSQTKKQCRGNQQ